MINKIIRKLIMILVIFTLIFTLSGCSDTKAAMIMKFIKYIRLRIFGHLLNLIQEMDECGNYNML